MIREVGPRLPIAAAAAGPKSRNLGTAISVVKYIVEVIGRTCSMPG